VLLHEGFELSCVDHATAICIDLLEQFLGTFVGEMH
jgi:hypothetical protein